MFRATGITAYLEARGTLENAQAMAAHESPRTTKLYDRTDDAVTLDSDQNQEIVLPDISNLSSPTEDDRKTIKTRQQFLMTYILNSVRF